MTYERIYNTNLWLSTAAVAELTGFKPRTIAKWIREEKVEARKVGRVWRVNYDEVRELIENLAKT